MSVTDGTAYLVAKEQISFSSLCAGIYYRKNHPGGATTVSVTANTGDSSHSHGYAMAHEYSGIDTISPVDIAIGASGANTFPATGSSGVLAQANELVVAVMVGDASADGAGMTNPPNTGYTNLKFNSSQFTEVLASIAYKIVSSTTAVTADLGTTTNSLVWDYALVTFKQAASTTAPFAMRDWHRPVQRKVIYDRPQMGSPAALLQHVLPFTYNNLIEQYIQGTGGPPYNAFSMFTDIDSALGNYLIVPLTWSPSGNSLSIGGDGIPYMTSPATGRQSATYREWDTVDAAYIQVVGGGHVATYYVNNTAPVLVGNFGQQDAYTHILYTGPVLDDFFSDAQADGITFSCSGLPAGITQQTITQNSGLPTQRIVQQIKGTATTTGVYSVTITATDSLGQASNTVFTLNVGTGVLVPNVADGLTPLYTAFTAIQAVSPTSIIDISYQASAVPVGNVISIVPAAGTYMPSGQGVILVVSGANDDTALQVLLDPNNNRTGILIQRRFDAGPTANYYVVPIGLLYRGRSRWVETLLTDTNTIKASKITTALTIPAQPTIPQSNP